MAEPTLQDIVTYGGMAAGAAIAAVLVRLGWSKGPVKDTELAISGGASIIDTSPMRDLVKNVDLLTLQLQKAAVQDERRTQALERLADVLADYLKAQTERQEKNDLAAMVRDELRREMESRGEEPATQPSHKS